MSIEKIEEKKNKSSGLFSSIQPFGWFPKVTLHREAVNIKSYGAPAGLSDSMVSF